MGKTIDLSSRAKFRMSGADRLRYLNGQVSNDVSKAGEDVAISACVTNLKGKLQGLVNIAVEAGGGAFLIDADGALRESLLARLGKYIIADDVELDDLSEDYLLLHELGDAAGGIASNRYAQPGGDRWLPAGELPAGADWLSPQAVEQMRVEQGVPAWGAELTEDTLPAEALLDRGSIDFHKGCYVGQEVISRIESVGRVNRSLVGLSFGEGESAAVGWALLDESGAQVGVVTSVAQGTSGESIGIGYLKRAAGLARAGDCQTGQSCEVAKRDAPYTTQT